MESLDQILELAQLGTNGILLVGLWIVWRKLQEVLREKDEAMKSTIKILKELVHLETNSQNKD